MRVRVEVLRAALNRLLDHVEEIQGEEVSIDEFSYLYWFIQRPDLYGVDANPKNLTIGSLVDDWEEVSAIGSGEKEPIGYALVWASTLLRAIGDRTP